MPKVKISPPQDPELPHNLEAERAFLGSIMLDNESYRVVAGTIKPNDLFTESHRIILGAIETSLSRNDTVDFVVVTDELDKTPGQLEKVGGASYVSSLVDGVPVGDNSFISNYVSIIKDKSVLRCLVRLASHLTSEVNSGTAAVTIIERSVGELEELSAEVSLLKDEGTGFRDSAYSLINRLRNPGRYRVYSGISDLDDNTGGFLANELIILTAGTGVGKSVLAAQIRSRACQDGIHGLFCSAEMTKEHIVSREIVTPASVSRWKIRHPEKLTDEEFSSLSVAAEDFCPICRILDGPISLRRIKSAARRLKAKYDIGLLIVDYDELVEVEDTKNDLEAQIKLSSSLKRLSGELGIPVVQISQLRKALNDQDRKNPTLSKVYGSSAKTNNASIVLYVDREYATDLTRGHSETKATISVLKNRDGRCAKLDVFFDVNTLTFTSEPAAKPSHSYTYSDD